MAKFWCKVCGQPLAPIEGAVVATCGLCSARQALPSPLSDEYLERYAELVRLQQGGQFEQAEVLLENMLPCGGADAALYWMCVLIAYKAVYSSDNSGYFIVCNKAGETAVLEHESFQKVLHYASPAQRGVFEKDGRLLESARLAALGRQETGNETDSPLNKGFLCLEDGAWDAAMTQFDRVLAETPENALAYFGKMMAELQVNREGELSRVGTRLSEAENYEKVLQYGDDVLCERLNKYRESGILFQATEHGKCAETIDDWKHVKKLLMEIRENERAGEYLALCDRKIRAIMVREAQLVMGCREAVNLGLTTENLGTRMVSANYYYDFDMSDTEPSKKRSLPKLPSGRVLAVFVLVVLVLLAALFVLSFWLEKSDTEENIDSDQSSVYMSEAEKETIISGTGTDTYAETAEGENDDINYDLCIVGTRAFILDSNGNVVSLSDPVETETPEETQSGASFAVNITPYESDFSSWSDVSRLYSDPDGAMLFGVMENGTVAYDIFSPSTMNYENTYRAVSSWMGVEQLVWEMGEAEKPCLFAVTKNGELYASDEAVQGTLRQLLDPLLKQGVEIASVQAQDGVLHLMLRDGSYVSVVYK